MEHKYRFKLISGMFMYKIMGHSNIKMMERYAKLGRAHMAKTGGTARKMWKLLGPKEKGNTVFNVPALFPAAELMMNWLPLSYLECGGQRRDRIADADLFRSGLGLSTKTVSSDPTPANRAGELQQ
jgi:hypothetical protein